MASQFERFARTEVTQLKHYSVDETPFAIKLDANESPYDVPAAIKTQVAEKLTGVALNRYPACEGQLTDMIASALGLDVKQVVLGNGSSELLQAIASVFGGAGKRIVYTQPSFSMYGIYAQLTGAEKVVVPLEADYGLPVDKLIASAQDASLLFISNPNNPTGTLYAVQDIEKIIASVECPVVIDEAYAEFADVTVIPLLAKYNNLIVTRTFSKAYGLAAVRLGYLCASEEMTALIGKALMPYHINALTLVCGEVVFENRKSFASVWKTIIAEREKLATELAVVEGVQVFASSANFILLKTSMTDGQVGSKLAGQSIGVRDFSGSPGLAGCVRVNIGTPDENQAFLKAFKQILNEVEA